MSIDISRHQPLFDPFSFQMLHQETTVIGGNGVGSYVVYHLAKLGLTRLSIRASGAVSLSDRRTGAYTNHDDKRPRHECLRQHVLGWTGENVDSSPIETAAIPCRGSVVFITTGSPQERINTVRDLVDSNQALRLIIEISRSGPFGFVRCISTRDYQSLVDWVRWREVTKNDLPSFTTSICATVALATLAVWQLTNFRRDGLSDSGARNVRINLERYGLVAPSELYAHPITSRIGVAGLGAVGSHLSSILLKLQQSELLVPQQLSMMDFDTVEAHNISNQAFGIEHVGLRKAEAMHELIKAEKALPNQRDNSVHATCYAKKLTGMDTKLGEVLFLLVDVPEARRQIVVEGASKLSFNRLVIETGLASEGGFVSSFDPKVSTAKFLQRLSFPASVNGNGCNIQLTAGPAANFLASLAAGRLIKYWTSAEFSRGQYIKTSFDMKSGKLVDRQ
jgi:tRNA A37 threonylcarbamoyladenosine dehydratase